MVLFKSSKDDPKTGDQSGDDPQDGGSKQPQYMTMEQFQEQIKPFQETLSAVNKSLEALSGQQKTYQQPTAPAPPAEDPFKADKERISQIDVQLEEISKKVDQAAMDGRGVGDLMRQQNSLMIERSELHGKVIAGAGDPRIDAGIQTIDALTNEVISGKMPYLSIPGVKDRYDYYVAQLMPEQRMNPQAKMGCYNLAVGENLQSIEEAKKQEWLRDMEDGRDTKTQDQTTGAGTGRQHQSGGDGATPPPEKVLSRDALQTIKKSRHHNPDSYYRSLGYEGWDDYYAKNKEYLTEGEEE